MNKKMLAFIPVVIASVSFTCVVASSNNPLIKGNATDFSYTVALNSDNAYVGGDSNTITTTYGNEIDLAYVNATSQVEKHVALGVDGVVKNTTQITGIKNVLVNYTGELTLSLGLDGVSYEDVTISSGASWVASDVTYNYFALTATSSSVIESVVITYSCREHVEIDTTITILEGGAATEDGLEYYTDDLPVFTHTTNPDGLPTEYWFSMNDGAVNLGQEVPTEVGTYAYNVKVTKIGYDNSSAWVWFRILAPGITPTITITVGGVAAKNGETYYTNALPEFDFEVDPIDAPATFYYTAEGGATNLGQEAPSEPGTYAYNVKVEGEGYKPTSAFIWYELEEAPSAEVITPVITFFYKGSEIDIAGNSNHWIAGGYAASVFKASDFDPDDLTWTVSDDLEYTVKIECEDEVLSELVAPLAAGTYTVRVSVAEGENNTAASEYVLFAIKPDGVEPVIEFFYKGEAVVQTGSGWFNGTYGESKIEIAAYTNGDFTWTVTPDVPYEVSYTLDEASIEEIDPTVGGSYCIKITVPETEDTIETSRYILFKLV